MFDPAGEQAFIEECHELLTQKTVILITHRPASLALAHTEVVIPDEGSVYAGIRFTEKFLTWGLSMTPLEYPTVGVNARSS
jgi:ABC-type transport system involved in cytochrome bd biosynthesis fused ATPase/permease subunit